MKKNILVIFGGKSVEHDISVITGHSVLMKIDKKSYNIIPIYITKEGEFLTAENLDDIAVYKNFNKNVKKRQEISFLMGSSSVVIKRPIKIDAAILCTHGYGGEDGCLSGLMELACIPYTSSGVMSSAVAMDKVIMKDVFFANMIPSVDYVKLSRSEFEADRGKIIQDILNRLELPVIIKPSSLGSSIGISHCHNEEELLFALKVAFMYDDKVLAENFLEDVTEINCACIGTANDVTLSQIEAPKKSSGIFSFDEKYLKEKNTNQAIEKEIEEDVKKLALKVFKTFYCSGVVRIDFLYDNKGKNLYVNELNTIPGSLAFHLFAPNTFSAMIEELINCAYIKHQDKKRNASVYESAAIDIFSKVKSLTNQKFPK